MPTFFSHGILKEVRKINTKTGEVELVASLTPPTTTFTPSVGGSTTLLNYTQYTDVKNMDRWMLVFRTSRA